VENNEGWAYTRKYFKNLRGTQRGWPIATTILRKTSKRLRGANSCQHLYLKKFLRGGGEGSIEISFIVAGKPSPSL